MSKRDHAENEEVRQPSDVAETAAVYRIDEQCDRGANGPIGIESAFQPVTPLGKQLWEIRSRIVASGEPLLDWDDIEEEVLRRRGGVEA